MSLLWKTRDSLQPFDSAVERPRSWLKNRRGLATLRLGRRTASLRMTQTGTRIAFLFVSKEEPPSEVELEGSSPRGGVSGGSVLEGAGSESEAGL